MKNIIQILILILISSCGENQSIKTKIGKRGKSEKVLVKESIENKFIPDSSHVEYWCSIEVLNKAAESLEKLELPIVAELLATFHEDCTNNVEYSEWANELLFEVAKRRPDFILQLLHKNSSLDKELIRKHYESPIYNGFELDEIIDKVERANSPVRIKNEIIKSLKIARSKY